MRLYGKNPVIERLRASPHTIRKISIQQGFKGAGNIYKKAKQHGIPVMVVPKSKMQKIGRNVNAQGIVIDVTDYEYILYDDLLENALKKKKSILFLDNLNDPQNLGAIIRTAGCLGSFSIVLPTHKSVGVTEAVLRIASGAENYVNVAQVANISKAIRMAKDKGYNIVGSVVKDGEPLDQFVCKFPVALVLGSEQSGIRDAVLKNVDQKVTLNMPIHTLSLNVSHAASIFCYEITRQSKNKSK